MESSGGEISERSEITQGWLFSLSSLLSPVGGELRLATPAIYIHGNLSNRLLEIQYVMSSGNSCWRKWSKLNGCPGVFSFTTFSR
jgi:hypothetical protein